MPLGIYTYKKNNNKKINKLINIWTLKKKFYAFNLFLSSYRNFKKTKLKEISLIKNFFINPPHDEKYSLQITGFLLTFGSAFFLNKLQKNLSLFKSTLTINYYHLLKKINFNINHKDQLIFNTTNPDIYLWIPKKISCKKKLLIIWPSKRNSLNMPYHLAHFILAELDISLMYLRNRPGVEIQDGFKNMSIIETSKIIKKISNEHGFSELYGLGVSYGGHKIISIAHHLKLKKILNFSGFAKNTFNNSIKNKNYSDKNILSILSKNDNIDKNILNHYKKDHFGCQFLFLEKKTHGTFTAAFLESKLKYCFDWLLN